MTDKRDHRNLQQIERIRQVRCTRLQGRLAILRRDAELLEGENQAAVAKRQALREDKARSAVASTLHSGHRVAGKALHATARRQQYLAVAVAEIDEQIAALASRAMHVSKQIGECETDLSVAQRNMLRLRELIKLSFRPFRRG